MNHTKRKSHRLATTGFSLWKGSTKKMPLGFSLSYQYWIDFEISQDFRLVKRLIGISIYNHRHHFSRCDNKRF